MRRWTYDGVMRRYERFRAGWWIDGRVLVAGICLTMCGVVGSVRAQATQPAVEKIEGLDDGPAGQEASAVEDAAIGGDAPGESVAGDKQPPALPEVRVRLQGVNYNESIQFDEAGHERHRHSNLNVQMRVGLVEAEGVASYGGLKVESAVTSAGERLTAPHQQRQQARHPVMNHNRFGGGGQEFHAHCQLTAPTLAADAIAELRGTVTLLMVRGEVKQAALLPIELYDGRPVRVVGIEGVRVKVTRLADRGMVRVEFPQSGPPLEGVTFLDEHRQVMPQVPSRSSGSSGDRVHQDYPVRLPDGGGVLLRWRSAVEEVEVPFVVTDIPLPGHRGGAMELSVVAKPLGGGADPLAGLELLEVEVVEEN